MRLLLAIFFCCLGKISPTGNECKNCFYIEHMKKSAIPHKILVTHSVPATITDHFPSGLFAIPFSHCVVPYYPYS